MIVIKTIISIIVFIVYNFFLISLFAIPYMLIISGIRKYILSETLNKEKLKQIYLLSAGFGLLTISLVTPNLTGLTIKFMIENGF